MKAEDDSSRTKNVKRNMLYGFMQVTASQILPFIVRTILIYRFGVNYLGLSSVFASILNVLSLMELGFGTAVVYSMYQPVADNDTEQICAYLSYYRKIYRVIGMTVLLAGLLCMPFLKWLIKDPDLPDGLNLYVCYLIYLSNPVISYLLFGYMSAIPMSHQRRDILSRIDMGMTLLKCTVQSFVLLFSSFFYMYLIIMPIVTVTQNLITAHIVKKTYPDLKCTGELSVEQKLNLKNKVVGILINKLTSVSRNSIDSLCISSIIGLTVSGLYSNYYFILRCVLVFSGIICESMMASVGNSIAVEKKEKNYADMRKFDFIYMCISGWAAVCMLCLFQPFITFWLGNSMLLDLPVVLGLSIYFYILKTGDIRWIYQEGAGLWFECRYIMIGEASANVLLNILLCRLMGVAGIVLATVLSVFVTNCLLCPRILFKMYFKNGKLQEYWKDHLFYTLTTAISALASWMVCSKLFPMSLVIDREIVNSIVCLGGRLLICTLIFSLAFWMIWHKSIRYTESARWIKRAI